MIKFFFTFLCILTILSSCSFNTEIKSSHPLADYFYPLDSIPKVYLYRDVANGLEEEFHRIYSIKDDEGKHLIVERYVSDGRIVEALNYNIDSLDIQDHMVVNFRQEKTKALLYKTKLFPFDKDDHTWFASKFPGINDSTVFLREVKRNLVNLSALRRVMENKVICIDFNDYLRQTLINPFTEKEASIEATMITFFGKGLGLVEWYSPNRKIHFRLEQILTQDEWLKIISH